MECNLNWNQTRDYKIARPRSGSAICNHKFDFSLQNCTTRSSISTLLYSFCNLFPDALNLLLLAFLPVTFCPLRYASIPKVVGSIPTVTRHIFQACPVWIYTQSNITNISFKKFKILCNSLIVYCSSPYCFVFMCKKLLRHSRANHDTCKFFVFAHLPHHIFLKIEWLFESYD